MSPLVTTSPPRTEKNISWTGWPDAQIGKARSADVFLNESLHGLPLEAVEAFERNSRPNWRSAFFEVIVARALQELGATLNIEQPNKAGKRPDFAAVFADGVVIVEAVSPVFNSVAGETMKRQRPLLKIIEAQLPEGFIFAVWELPKIGLADSKKEFKKAVEFIFSNLPKTLDNDRIEISHELSNGDLRITIFPSESRRGRVAVEPAIAVFDNSEDRIRNAVRRKRIQVRDSEDPVVLAIDASGISSELEDFERALFGCTFERVDVAGRKVETGLEPNGLFATTADKDPTYAGVLAFLEVGFQKCPNPVLFLHPRFKASLPRAIQALECRVYNPYTNQIEVSQSSVDVMERLNFVRKP